MSRAQFQLYTWAGSDTTTEPQRSVRWRLITANHRDLGRGIRPHSDVESATTEIATLVAGVRAVAGADLVSPALAVDTSDGLWRWVLRVQGVDLAMASRGYLRRVECQLSVRAFMSLAVTAPVTAALRTFDLSRSRGSSGPSRTGPRRAAGATDSGSGPPASDPLEPTSMTPVA